LALFTQTSKETSKEAAQSPDEDFEEDLTPPRQTSLARQTSVGSDSSPSLEPAAPPQSPKTPSRLRGQSTFDEAAQTQDSGHRHSTRRHSFHHKKGRDKGSDKSTADPTRPFTGLKELTLRKAGRMVGGGRPMALAQKGLLDAMQLVDMLEGLLTWKRQDFKLGFKDLDGPLLATGWVLGNLFAVGLHLLVELRFIAMVFMLGVFSLAVVQRLGTMLPQGLKVQKERAKMRSEKLSGRPSEASSRKRNNKKELERLISSIFKRIDVDHSNAITLEELLDSVSRDGMADSDKEAIRDVFLAADDDESGELNEKEFRELVLQHTNTVALPLVVAELSRSLHSPEGLHVRKHPSTASKGLKGKLSSFMSKKRLLTSKASDATTSSQEDPTGQRSHGSALRVDPAGPFLLYTHRNGKWSDPIHAGRILRLEGSAAHRSVLLVTYENSADTPTQRLVLDVELEAVREALLTTLEAALGIAKKDDRDDGSKEGSGEAKTFRVSVSFDDDLSAGYPSPPATPASPVARQSVAAAAGAEKRRARSVDRF